MTGISRRDFLKATGFGVTLSALASTDYSSVASAQENSSLDWSAASDWDSAQSEAGIVHESVTNTDHQDATIIKQGYSIEAPPLSSNLVAYWPLHEDSGTTTYDFSGNSNNGTVNGPTVGVGAPLETTAYSFDGTDDYVNIPNIPLSSGSTRSINVWFKTSTAEASNLHNYDVDQPGRHLLKISSTGTVMGAFRNSSQNLIGGTAIESTTTVADGVWHMATLVYDGTDLILYIDAAQEASVTDSGATVSKISNSGRIGDHASTSSLFTGDIWDFRIYNTDLGPSEVQELYDVVDSWGTHTSSKQVI